MKVRRKSLAWLSALALMLGLVGGIGPAVKADTSYQLWVGGVEVTDINKGNIDGTGTASYDPESNTLTLNNYSYTGPGTCETGSDHIYGAILYEGVAEFTIDLKGNNSVTITESGTINIGIDVRKVTTNIIGNGSLNVESQGGSTSSYGIYVLGGSANPLSLNINADITAKSNTAEGDCYRSTAIVAGMINITGGKVKAISKGANSSIAISATTNILVSGGTVEAFAEDSYDNAIGLHSTSGNITIKGDALVKAEAGKSTRTAGTSAGIASVHESVSIEDKANVIARANQVSERPGYGIYCATDGFLTIGAGVEVEASGYTSSVNCAVKNLRVGAGFNDEESVTGTLIEINSTGRSLDYKTIYFPLPRQKETKAPVVKTNLVATGSPIQLIDPGTAPAGMLYAVERDTTAQYAGQYLATTTRQAPSEDKFTEDIPTATDPGTYYVWYMAKGDDVHRNSEPQMLEVTITAASNPEPDPTPDTPEAAPDTPEEKETTVTKVPLTGDKTIFSWLW